MFRSGRQVQRNERAAVGMGRDRYTNVQNFGVDGRPFFPVDALGPPGGQSVGLMLRGFPRSEIVWCHKAPLWCTLVLEEQGRGNLSLLYRVLHSCHFLVGREE